LLSEASNYIPVFTPPTTQNQTFFNSSSTPGQNPKHQQIYPHQPCNLQNRVSSEALDYSTTLEGNNKT
ncbi:MAG: hypothetical protein KKF51_20470, partial [Gammaproteobacteria bacterium]|nr:hypothetical protein [Gammaproteobacteria bacterium]MBU2202809.1 hypothetical protein [Gammaproteobacteria bacterium]MBU2276548.1 hypothetical protein [Gammaproteobacteria bacterium]MBU2356090.1 hypothetical protein [Gammaproteobacteria bacterium]